MASTTEQKQEQAASVETGVILLNATESQIRVYQTLQAKYRMVDTLESLAVKGFNQALKSGISSAIARQKTLYTDAHRAGNDKVLAQAELSLEDLEKMAKFLR
ncbi:MAG TPA: hypothetical protein VGF75_08275 [Candidatus Saccharimonadales bacterium]|jgi:hypothetical protein